MSSSQLTNSIIFFQWGGEKPPTVSWQSFKESRPTMVFVESRSPNLGFQKSAGYRPVIPVSLEKRNKQHKVSQPGECRTPVVLGLGRSGSVGELEGEVDPRELAGDGDTTDLVNSHKMGPPVDSGLSCLRKVAKNARYNELVVFMGVIYHGFLEPTTISGGPHPAG